MKISYVIGNYVRTISFKPSPGLDLVIWQMIVCPTSSLFSSVTICKEDI